MYANQYGFRNNQSVNHALLDVVTNCYDALHCSQHTALLFMDLRKMFDTVSHKILLHKLQHYGIRGPAYVLIENYLTSRNQFVTFNNTSSSTKPINIGIPQGSILGPLLFLIYINNLPNAINSTLRFFADDTFFILRQSSLSSLEKACLDKLIQLKDWCDANKIQINPNKSCILHLPPKQNTPPLTFQIPYDNSFIVNSICGKYLGFIIDNKLNFKQYIQLVESKIAKSVGILNKLRHIFSSSALVLIYFSLVHPHLLYGLPISGSTFPTYLQKLLRLQNKAVRIISNCNSKTSTTPLFYQYKILKIQDLYYLEIAKIMHQYSNKHLPICFTSFFTQTSSIHNRSARSNIRNNLYLPHFLWSRCQRSIKFQGAKIWNSISPHIRNQSFNTFKRNIKIQLLNSYI